MLGFQLEILLHHGRMGVEISGVPWTYDFHFIENNTFKRFTIFVVSRCLMKNHQISKKV